MSITPMQMRVLENLAQSHRPSGEPADEKPVSHRQMNYFYSARTRAAELKISPDTFVTLINQLADDGFIERFMLGDKPGVGFTPAGFAAWRAFEDTKDL